MSRIPRVFVWIFALCLTILAILVDKMATSAVVARLRSRYRAHQASNAPAENVWQLRPLHTPANVLNGRHKFYIEKFRISTIAAEISWSGALPIASSLPRLLRPAFTFEGLPVLLRPLSNTHSYGTIDDHLQSLRSHYFSIWRILDLLVGVLTKPSFVFRAVVFTWRESFGSVFDSFSSGLQSTESLLMKLTTASQSTRPVFRQYVGPFVKFNLALVHGLAAFASAGSRVLRYNAAQHHASGMLVRSRNPRLFANINGKDLLVEYVEGENAGRAFLSRVAMGMHLGEGYNFHMEGVRLSLVHLSSRSAMKSRSSETDLSNYILMMTFERVLLLSGLLNDSFCDVVWDAKFSDVVHVELRDVDQQGVGGDGSASFLLLVWWYLHTAPRGIGREESMARDIVNDVGGLAALACRQMYVPRETASNLLSRIRGMNPDWQCNDETSYRQESSLHLGHGEIQAII